MPSYSSTTFPTALRPRAEPSSSSDTSNLCLSLEGGKILISKRTLIIAIALCALLTCLSLLAATLLIYREWNRRRQAKEAKVWGRISRYEHRISLMRKEVDKEYSRHYTGYLQHEPENPEMGSDSPVEMMLPEPSEVPAVPAQAVAKAKRKSKVMSLVFDHGVGMWLPKRQAV